MLTYSFNILFSLLHSRANLTTNCNSNCSCDGVHYSPVCHKPTGQIYFSPCHAGCKDQLLLEQVNKNHKNCNHKSFNI